MIHIQALILTSCLVQVPTVSSGHLDAVANEIALHEKVAPETINQDFNLDRPEVSSFLLARMNAPTKRGKSLDSALVLRRLLKTDPAKTTEWMIDHLRELTPAGSEAAVKSLSQSDVVESYQLWDLFMKDQREIADPETAALLLPGMVPMRVCDEAYSALAWKLYVQKVLPQDLRPGLGPAESISNRNHAITRLEYWWAANSREFLASKKSLSTARPSIATKLAAVSN